MTGSRMGVAPPAYRLPDATHVGAVDLQVSDLERSLAYYQQVLGLRVIAREGSRAELGSAGSQHPLLRPHPRLQDLRRRQTRSASSSMSSTIPLS